MRHKSVRAVLLCVVVVAVLALVAAPAVATTPSSTTDGATTVVHGVLTDNAVVKKAIRNATVTVAGMPATVSGQSYTVADVPVGQQTIVVSAARHVKLTQLVVILAGDNTINVSLGLTAKETYLRYFNSYNHFRYWTAYKMVHPDVRAHYPFARYRDYMWFFTHPPYLSTRVLQVRTLATWRPRYLHKTYRDVKAITSERPYKCMGEIITERGVGQWDEISGRWYRIFDWH